MTPQPPFVNVFQSFSRSVALQADKPSSHCLEHCEFLMLILFLPTSCWLLYRKPSGFLEEHENRHQPQKRPHQPTAETPFMSRHHCVVGFVSCDAMWWIQPWLVLCYLTAFMVCSPGLSHSPSNSNVITYFLATSESSLFSASLGLFTSIPGFEDSWRSIFRAFVTLSCYSWNNIQL